MTVGTSGFMGLAVPLFGESELKQDTAATDFVTLTGDSSISGDFLVCRAGTTEKAWITSAGKVYLVGGLESAANVVLATTKTLKFSTPISTAVPTTGLAQGEILLVMKSTTPQLMCCVSAAGNTVAYFNAVSQTFGRSTCS